MGLCFSGLVFFVGTRRDGLGEPTRSRAISRTTLLTENVFFLRFFGTERPRGFQFPLGLDLGLCIFAHSLAKSAIIKIQALGFRLPAFGSRATR